MGKEKTAVVATEAEELPKTIVRRIVKDKLSEVSSDGSDVVLHKEALIAFSESARIFIHYLSATAHDICSESKRQIINADDVMKALEEIEFPEFVEPLKAPLDEFRKKAAVKRSGSAKSKEANKKQKTDEETATENGKDENKLENGKDEDKLENGKDEDKLENGKDEDKLENGKDKVDNEANNEEDENGEEASEGDDDSHDS